MLVDTHRGGVNPGEHHKLDSQKVEKEEDFKVLYAELAQIRRAGKKKVSGV